MSFQCVLLLQMCEFSQFAFLVERIGLFAVGKQAYMPARFTSLGRLLNRNDQFYRDLSTWSISNLHFVLWCLLGVISHNDLTIHKKHVSINPSSQSDS